MYGHQGPPAAPSFVSFRSSNLCIFDLFLLGKGEKNKCRSACIKRFTLDVHPQGPEFSDQVIELVGMWYPQVHCRGHQGVQEKTEEVEEAGKDQDCDDKAVPFYF